MPPLKAMVLPSFAAVPPMVLTEALSWIWTPSEPLPSGWVPVLSVPMKFPSTRMSVALFSRTRPYWLLPEMTSRVAAVVPPTTSPMVASSMPSLPLGMATVPVLSVPMRLPSMVLSPTVPE